MKMRIFRILIPLAVAGLMVTAAFAQGTNDSDSSCTRNVQNGNCAMACPCDQPEDCPAQCVDECTCGTCCEAGQCDECCDEGLCADCCGDSCCEACACSDGECGSCPNCVENCSDCCDDGCDGCEETCADDMSRFFVEKDEHDYVG